MRAHVHSIAGEGPPLVYVPGIDGTGVYLLGTGERLAAKYRVLRLRYAVDDPPPPGDPYQALARSIRACLTAAGVERYLVVAESFGGAVALQLALEDPDGAAGLLIVNSFAHYPWRLRLALSRATVPLLPLPLFRILRPRLAGHVLFRPRRDPEVEAKFHAEPITAFDAGYRHRLTMIRDLDLRPRLPEVRQPVALYAADSDRVVDSVPAARVMHDGLPDSTLEILDEAGHLVLPLPAEPWVERVDALARRCDFS